MAQAMPPFISTAPRPYISPSAISPENGGCFHAFSSPSVPASLNFMRCTVKPAALSVFSMKASAPPSAGVTEGQRSRSRAMIAGSADIDGVRLSVPQQFIDAGLGARAFVDALDDDGAIKPRAAAFAGQRARHDDRIGRHLALRDGASLAVDDAGRSA